MKTILKRRQILLVVVTGTILLLTILAAGLSDIRLAPAQPLNFGEGEIRPIQQTLAEVAQAFSTTPLWQQVALVGIFLFMTVLALIFLPAELRKRLLRSIIRMAFFAVAILFFFNNYQINAEMAPFDSETFSMEETEEGEMIVAETQVFEPKEVSPIWGYLITLIVLGIFGVTIWRFWHIWRLLHPVETTPLKEFARIARKSLDDLADGAEWEDVIVRSYVQMGEVVSERRGIQRADEMTPHEFAERLVAAGLPADPVQRLTRLFEFVRYSPHKAGEEEMAEAVGCFNQIAATFGEKLK